MKGGCAFPSVASLHPTTQLGSLATGTEGSIPPAACCRDGGYDLVHKASLTGALLPGGRGKSIRVRLGLAWHGEPCHSLHYFHS